MVAERAERGGIRSNESWTDTLLQRSEIAIGTHMYVIAGRANIMSSPGCLLLQTYLTNLPGKDHQHRACTPTQAEVDAYVNSLEHVVAAEQKRLRQIENTRKTELTKRSKPSTFWWCVVAAIIGCIYWALRS